MNFRKILFILTIVSLAVAMPALAQTKKQRKINKANYEAAKAREAADTLKSNAPTQFVKKNTDSLNIKDSTRVAKAKADTPKVEDVSSPQEPSPKAEADTRIAKSNAKNDTLEFKDRLQAAKIKTDTLNGKIKKVTGLEAQLPALNPSANLSLPGGKNKSTSLSTLLGETIPDLGLKAKEFKSRRSERRRRAKKGRLAKVQYEGIPMQKIEVKFGSGDRATIEEFHVLKEPKPISPYIRDISWYDLKTKKRSGSVIKDKDRAYPLHGPYKKYKAGELIEEGFYYMGTKDGRWARYDNDYNLLDKSHWYHGFPAESQIAFYDSAHTKIKEVLPIQFEDVDGDYFQFYDEGQLMTFGRYDGGQKVGRWVEYYQYRRQRKKEVQYRKTRWDEDFDPYVIREWDDQGKLIYDNKNDPRTSAEVDDQN